MGLFNQGSRNVRFREYAGEMGQKGLHEARKLRYKQWLCKTFFLLERGVRQGCPLSGILFVIAVELLACAIRSDKSIKGLSIITLTNSSYPNMQMTQPVLSGILYRLAICLKNWISSGSARGLS